VLKRNQFSYFRRGKTLQEPVVYKASQVLQKHFIMLQISSKGTGLLHMMEESFRHIFPAKERDLGGKKRQNNNKKT